MNHDLSPEAPHVLVIGYGNVLRGDDGAGPCVAQALASARMPQVDAIAIHQLVPELATRLAHARLAFFVDAYPATMDGSVNLERIEPTERPEPLGHVGDPRCLLALVRALHGAHPAAWWVKIPGVCFEAGEGLSATASKGVATAVGRIASLAREGVSQQ